MRDPHHLVLVQQVPNRQRFRASVALGPAHHLVRQAVGHAMKHDDVGRVLEVHAATVVGGVQQQHRHLPRPETLYDALDARSAAAQGGVLHAQAGQEPLYRTKRPVIA